MARCAARQLVGSHSRSGRWDAGVMWSRDVAPGCWQSQQIPESRLMTKRIARVTRLPFHPGRGMGSRHELVERAVVLGAVLEADDANAGLVVVDHPGCLRSEPLQFQLVGGDADSVGHRSVAFARWRYYLFHRPGLYGWRVVPGGGIGESPFSRGS